MSEEKKEKVNENKKVKYRNLKQKWKVVRKDREEKYHNDMTVEDLARIAAKYGMDLKINLVPRNQEENNDNTQEE